MKRILTYKGLIIASPSSKDKKDNPNIAEFHIFLKDEWELGEGLRYPEHEGGSIEECKQFIDCY